MMGMNWLDITVIAILLVFFVTGLLRGLVRQVFSVLAIGGGITVATMFFDLAGFMLVQKGYIVNISVANVIGFILVLLISYIIIQLVGWLVTKFIGTLQLNWADRAAGGVLGTFFGFLVCIILIAGLTFFYGPDDPIFKDSTATPYLNTGYLLLKDAIPDDIDTEFQRARKLIRQKGIVAASKVKEIVVEDKAAKEKQKTTKTQNTQTKTVTFDSKTENTESKEVRDTEEAVEDTKIQQEAGAQDDRN